jgi:hypothetical protein
MSLTTQDVWDAIGDSIFGVLGFVNQSCAPRTACVCFVTDGRSLLMTLGQTRGRCATSHANPMSR